MIRVFNAHLETTGLNRTLAKVSKLKKAGLDLGDNKAIDAIYGNYVLGIMARTGQANIVANEIRQANQKIFRGATLRMTSMAVAEAFYCPVAYVDAQMRLKEAQFRNAGIAVDDLRSMASHKDAKLRLGYVFKNVAAEDYGVGLRYNMQAGEKSPISRAYATRENVVGEEALHDWPPRYGLVGFCKTSASYSMKKKNVRAFMCFQTESESL